MKKGEVTKQKIIEEAARLYRQQGYHATGMSQILEASQTPKGSLYFHFPKGKESIALAAISCSGGEMREKIDFILASKPWREGLALICQLFADELANSNYLNGCPIATLTLEMSSKSEQIREACSQSYRNWEDVICSVFEQEPWSQETKEKMARLVLSSVEGALLLARAYRSKEPLLSIGEMLSVLVPPESEKSNSYET